ncbi:hypothetical protein Y032_0071g565 [Ancylostoma ceylanicum]|uniref:Uncharacterized protein n=1 Tax=Ancylostoma ceylanicum TaxID=53326 RepID=A0A016TW44_9BILA|nr:hypothetical protein Y032_0071g565 [Ancylostoma ceylanicum]
MPDRDEVCKETGFMQSMFIAVLLLFVYLMITYLYPRSKRMRSCNFVSIELPPAIYNRKNLIGVGAGPNGAPTLPSLFLTAAELAMFSHEPPAPQRGLLLTPEEGQLLRAESKSGCYLKGREHTLFKWKYGDGPTTMDTVSKEFRTGDTTVGTVEVAKTTAGATMNTADTVDVERRYKRKGAKADAEEGMEFN